MGFISPSLRQTVSARVAIFFHRVCKDVFTEPIQLYCSKPNNTDYTRVEMQASPVTTADTLHLDVRLIRTGFH